LVADNPIVSHARSGVRRIRDRIEGGVASFVKAIFMCGLLELPLRGHADPSSMHVSNNIFELPDSRFGCFNGLLYTMMDAGSSAIILVIAKRLFILWFMI
jgi:hypothetical protein